MLIVFIIIKRILSLKFKQMLIFKFLSYSGYKIWESEVCALFRLRENLRNVILWEGDILLEELETMEKLEEVEFIFFFFLTLLCLQVLY